MLNTLKKALLESIVVGVTVTNDDITIVKQAGSRNKQISIGDILGKVKPSRVGTSFGVSTRTDVSKWINDDTTKITPRVQENLENLNAFVGLTIIGVSLYETTLTRKTESVTATFRCRKIEPDPKDPTKTKPSKVETMVFNFTRTR